MNAENSDQSGSYHGPIQPTEHASVRARSVGEVEITAGFWHDRRSVNGSHALPSSIDWLARAGNLENLRIAAGISTTGFRGPDYMDSDIYKVMESAYWQRQHTPDPALREFCAQATDLIEAAQRPDGYLHSPTQAAGRAPYAKLTGSHEHYCAGHLFQAAVAECRGTGQRQLLPAARRLADHLWNEFAAGRRHSSDSAALDGHPQVETGLVELFRETGESRYLELAREFVDARGYGRAGQTRRRPEFSQDHLPIRLQDSVAGHAVRALYLEAGVVDVAVETGDTELLRTSIARWDDMVATRTAITGGHGSRLLGEAFGDRYELPPDLGYNETCAAVAAIHWSWRLLLATGEARFADLVERLLYNGFAAAMSVDGRRFSKGNPLQRRPGHRPFEDTWRRQEWFPSACCPPNVTRLLASLQHYVATIEEENTLTVQQYVAGTIRGQLANGAVRLAIETDYPWSGTVEIRILNSPDTEWTLGLRIPSWSDRTTVRVGDRTLPTPAPGAYLRIDRRWRDGDPVRLEFPVVTRLSRAHPAIDALRGSVAVERGPLVYCVEQLDQPDDAPIDDLVLDPDAAAGSVQSEDRAGIGRTVALRIPARVRDTAGYDARRGLPYPSSTGSTLDGEYRRTTVTAIPYWQWDNRDDGPMRVWLSARD